VLTQLDRFARDTNATILAGFQVGGATGKGFIGVYIEKHAGTWANGGGFYVRTSCEKGD
jgi:hypothetical protein